MLKRAVIFLFFALSAVMVFGQMISRVAVVDMQRIYNEFARESQAFRDLESRTAIIQAQINQFSSEIWELRARYTNAVAANNAAEVRRLDTEITSKTENLRAFSVERMAEINLEKARLMQSDRFYNQIYDEIRYIGESEGYTHVVDISQMPGLIWFSPQFEITDRLLQSLRTRNR